MAPRPGPQKGKNPRVDTSWHEFAPCRRVPVNSPTVWFVVPLFLDVTLPDGTVGRMPITNPKHRPEVKAAQRYCDECPVRSQCWNQGAADPDATGIYGGEYWPPNAAGRRAILAAARQRGRPVPSTRR